MNNKRDIPLYAHTKEGAEESGWQPLEEHLLNVADRAASFAASFGYENWGRTLGILHDAGKVSSAFQRRLRGSGERVDHSTPGAWEALSRYRSDLGDANGRLLAFALVGHHGGIPNGVHGERTPLKSRLDKEGLGDIAREFNEYAANVGVSIPDGNSLEPIPLEKLAISGEIDIAISRGIFSTSVLVRMLFSCLVDADYLDTEHFVTPDVSAARDSIHRDGMVKLSHKLNAYMESLQSSAVPSREGAWLRNDNDTTLNFLWIRGDTFLTETVTILRRMFQNLCCSGCCWAAGGIFTGTISGSSAGPAGAANAGN